jgi:hypothetical protein
LGLLFENMRRLLLRSRRLLAASTVLLLVGVVALSTATRRPCNQESTGTWHTWKASRMTQAEDQEPCEMRVSAETQARQDVPKESSSTRISPEEALPPALSILIQIRHFRSPPARG